MFLSLWLKMMGWTMCMVLGSRSRTGKMSLIYALVVLSTFLLKWIEDFCKLGI